MEIDTDSFESSSPSEDQSDSSSSHITTTELRGSALRLPTEAPLLTPDTCGPCQRKPAGQVLEASWYCPQCDDVFCQECKLLHKLLRSLGGHALVSLHPPCDLCREKEFNLDANFFCEDCSHFLCDECSSCHKLFKRFDNHTVIRSEEKVKRDNLPEAKYVASPTSHEVKWDMSIRSSSAGYHTRETSTRLSSYGLRQNSSRSMRSSVSLQSSEKLQPCELPHQLPGTPPQQPPVATQHKSPVANHSFLEEILRQSSSTIQPLPSEVSLQSHQATSDRFSDDFRLHSAATQSLPPNEVLRQSSTTVKPLHSEVSLQSHQTISDRLSENLRLQSVGTQSLPPEEVLRQSSTTIQPLPNEASMHSRATSEPISDDLRPYSSVATQSLPEELRRQSIVTTQSLPEYQQRQSRASTQIPPAEESPVMPGPLSDVASSHSQATSLKHQTMKVPLSACTAEFVKDFKIRTHGLASVYPACPAIFIGLLDCIFCIPGDKKMPHTRGAAFLPDCRLLLVDENNRKLKMFDAKFQFICQKEFSQHVDDVSVFDSNEVAVVVRRKDYAIVGSLKFQTTRGDIVRLSINKNEMTEKGRISLMFECCGIAYIAKDKLAVLARDLVDNCFHVYSTAGKPLAKCNLGWWPSHVTVDRTGTRAYVSEAKTDSVYAVDLNANEVVFKYKHKKLSGPYGMAVDADNNLYVCGNGSRNVHQVSPEGKCIKILLTKRDGLDKPLVISFSPRGDIFIVAGDRMTVQVFEMLSE